jgi:hypothetical protein
MKLRWRKPTPRELRVGLPIAVPLLVLAFFMVRGARTGDFPHVKAPKATSATAPPSTTAPVDLTGVSIAGVDGTTTTTLVRATGTAHLSGAVNGPQGPVPGATVRLEHLAGGSVPIDVTSGPDGRYDAPNIAGGRYRVRAFLAPTFAQTDPQVFFLADGELRGLDLSVASFSGLDVSSAIAPDPPTRNQPATFVVRVANRSVDTGGIARAQPVVNASVVFVGGPDWSAGGSPNQFTDTNGDATFLVECHTPGATGVQVQVRPTINDPPQPITLTTSACADSATSSSSSSGSSSEPPRSSSGSSSSSRSSSSSSDQN